MADMASTPSTRKIKIALARQTPAFVRVERSDGDPVIIKPHGSRGKWQRVMESIPDDAKRIELLDKTKAVLWAHTLDQDDDQDTGDVPHAKGIDRIDQMFQLVQTANDVAQRRAQEFMEYQQAASLKVIDVLTARLVQLEANYSALLQLAADSSTTSGAPEESELDTENKNMLNLVLKAGIDKGLDRFLPAKKPTTAKPKLKVKANGKAATNG